MRIFGPTHLHGAQGINPPHYSREAKAPQSLPEPQNIGGDRLDLSPAAEAAARSAEMGEIRHDLINQIRQQIADGTYETPEKLDLAIERLLDEMA
ncbi:MAG: flagellar biosynthesis anti-sigma factor FlgM [Pirellulales bacterium]|nr:flagellar biosynthesis anti-sigma factor FlgM [Pirellulales bacterium]